MKNIKLSVMMLSVPSRIDNVFKYLFLKLCSQAEGKPVEVIALIDNKKTTIGRKREILVQAAQGDYVTFLDDDDDVDATYVDELLAVIERGENPDVIVFNQRAVINGKKPFNVRFGIENENEAETGKDIKRKPFHVCVWRADIAKRHHVPDCNWGEDWEWAKSMLTEVKTQARIEKTLHLYQFDSNKSEASNIGKNDKRDKPTSLSILISSESTKIDDDFIILFKQLCSLSENKDAEVLGLIDNGQRSADLKNNILIQCSRGSDVALVYNTNDVIRTNEIRGRRNQLPTQQWRIESMYSQLGEEKVILEHAPNEGYFLDIGSFNGTSFSNVRALALKGWSGVCIEPSPIPFCELLKLYKDNPKIELIQALVAKDYGLKAFHSTADALGTTEEGNYQKWKSVGQFQSILVSSIPLSDLLNRPFDFINIDTEGTSIDILESIDSNYVKKVKMICVEYDEHRQRAIDYFLKNGLEVVLDNDLNMIAVRR